MIGALTFLSAVFHTRSDLKFLEIFFYFRGYASSCRENREKENDDLQLKIAEKTNQLMEKRAKMEIQKRKQIDLIDAYKTAFRRVESYYNLRSKNKNYHCSSDLDIEEDLFESGDSDTEHDDPEEATAKEIVL